MGCYELMTTWCGNIIGSIGIIFTFNSSHLSTQQGEGAPTVRKGTCARHLHDIHKLLRGIHVTVNARTEEEVELDVVMAAVLKASATTYNFSERSEMNDKTTPVVSGLNEESTNSSAQFSYYYSHINLPRLQNLSAKIMSG